MNSKISDKDKKDWKKFLSNTERMPDKDLILTKKKKKILTFDLHGSLSSKLLIIDFVKSILETSLFSINISLVFILCDISTIKM